MRGYKIHLRRLSESEGFIQPDGSLGPTGRLFTLGETLSEVEKLLSGPTLPAQVTLVFHQDPAPGQPITNPQGNL